MKKLLLLMLCSIVVYDSYGQVAITVDETGKITSISKSTLKPADSNKTVSYVVLNTPKQNESKSLVEFIKKNIEKLKTTQLYATVVNESREKSKQEINNYNVLFPSLDYYIQHKKDGSIKITASNKADTILPVNNTTIKHNNTDIIAITQYHNKQFSPSIYNAWLKLQKVENDIFQLRDFIYNIQLSILNNPGLPISDASNEIDNAEKTITDILQKMGTIKNGESDFELLNKWMCSTSALSGSTFTMNALGIINTEKMPALPDTALLAKNIQTLTTKLNNESAYDYSALLMEQKRNNLQAQLNKTLSYYKQAAASENIKKQYAQYTIIGKYITTGKHKHYRFHNAADELKLTNIEKAKETVYQNNDNIVMYTYNIPPKGEIAYDMKSVGFMQILQFTRLAGGVVQKIQEDVNTLSLTEKKQVINIKELKSFNSTLQKLQKYQEAIAIYTATIPPADTIEFAKDIDKAYTTRVDELKELQNDSSYKHTYTLGLKVDGKEVIKPKSFNFITYKRSRIQFAAGVHFFSGNAPVVETEGTGFKTSSYNTPRYSAGIKVYLLPQTFADVNKKTWGRTLIRSWHVALLADAAKPLENQYLGIGFDLLPGLGINAGPHFYRYTAYQLYNNAVVGEKKTLKVRDGLQVSLTMDGGLAKDIFTSFLKLF